MDEIEQRLERIEEAIAALTDSVKATNQRLDTLSDRLGRQVAITEALRSDVRLFASVAQGMLSAVQGFAAAYADLSGRITDLENRAGG